MKKVFLIVTLFYVILTLILVNIKWTLDFYSSIDNSKKELNRNTINNNVKSLLNNNFYKYFLQYTGFETGYCFYARVGNDFITEISLTDCNGSLLAREKSIKVKSKESQLRINAAYSVFQEYRNNDTMNLEYKRCKILFKRLALLNLEHNKNASKAQISLYEYHYPTLEQIRSETQLNSFYVLYTRKTFTSFDK
jgi:hypothetical protein